LLSLVIRRRPLLLFSKKIFSSETTEQKETMFSWNGPWVVSIQNYVRQPCPPFQGAAVTKKLKFL
jgi:hypothetical protein